MATWTPIADAKLRQLWRSGLNRRRIAAAMGRWIMDVRQRMDALNLTREALRALRDAEIVRRGRAGESLAMISASVDMSTSRVREKLIAAGIRKPTLRRLFSDGECIALVLWRAIRDEWDEAGMMRGLGVHELTVALHALDSGRFGLPGHRQHADSHKVAILLSCSGGPCRRGFAVRKNNRVTLTMDGLELGKRLAARAASAAGKVAEKVA